MMESHRWGSSLEAAENKGRLMLSAGLMRDLRADGLMETRQELWRKASGLAPRRAPQRDDFSRVVKRFDCFQS